MSSKSFNPTDWLNSPPGESASVATSNPTHSVSSIGSEEDKIEQLVCLIESSCTDIAPDYASWRDMGFALADALGECGRSYFHRLSRFYPGYDEREAERQFTACLNSHGHGITIKTLFHLAKEAGIKLERNSDNSYNIKREEKRKTISPKSPKSPNSPSGEIEEIEEIEDFSYNNEPLPTFSQEVCNLLPKLLVEVVNKAKDFEDADLLTLGSLTALSACLPHISGIYAEREVFPNLFLFISAQASAGKGRLSLCRYLVKPIHDNLKKLYKLEMEEYNRQLNEYNQDKKSHEQPVEPPIKTLLIPANSSATSVYQVLNDNQGIGLIFETEGDTLANTFNSDYGNFSDGFRKAFHHEMISYTRRKDREFVELAKPRLSALLSGTPRQVLSLIPDAENGLFSRFIFYHMNIRLQWNDVFAGNTEALDRYFEQLGHQFFELYQTLQSSPDIRFSLSVDQQERFNLFFDEVQREYSDLFGLDIVASVRRLGLITFRIAMILTSLRIMEGLSITPIIVCGDTDFNTSLVMARVLLKHAARVFGTLQPSDTGFPSGITTALSQRFFNSLPQQFDRKTYLAIAEQLNIVSKTADRRIANFCEKGLLVHLSHGQYSKS